MGEDLGLAWRVASPGDGTEALCTLLRGVAVLVNAAGPFTATATPLIAACLATGTHYVDITGEVDVLERSTSHDVAARAAGVMVMPGAGFDVVASDALAAFVAAGHRWGPQATLRIGFDGPLVFSRGSVQVSLAQVGRGVLVRRGGVVVPVAPGSLAHDFDFGDGPREALAVSLGDVATAERTTGIRNVACYLRATPAVVGSLAAQRVWGRMLATAPWQSFLGAQAQRLAAGPSPEVRHAGRATLVAEVTDGREVVRRARLRTPEVYSFTAMSAVEVAERALGGDVRGGVVTPAQAYGPDLPLALDDVSREDLA